MLKINFFEQLSDKIKKNKDEEKGFKYVIK